MIRGSTNPSRLEVVGANVPPGVPDQPIAWRNSLGARTRAGNALEQHRARYGVGLGGGFLENADGAWLVSGGMLLLPPMAADRVKSGQELGQVMDDLSGETGIKTRGGAIGYLRQGRHSRREMWVNALQMALAPILSASVYGVSRHV